MALVYGDAMPIIRAFENLVPNLHPASYLAETAVVVGDVVLGQGSSL